MMTRDVLDATWDVAVIGSGIGGGIISRRLAELGLSVLILEKGSDLGDTSSGLPMTSAKSAEERLAAGAWPKPLVVNLDGRRIELEGVVGAAVGGTSLYFAATLERPEPHDLDTLPDQTHPTGGWPVSYKEYAPHFTRAEEYFHISGETDPLDPDLPDLPYPARQVSSTDRTIITSLKRDGLHPYQSHMAAKFIPGCENCFGRRCARRCKMDGRTAGVLPAIETGRVALLDNCEVLSIDADQRVQSLTCRRGSEEFKITARAYVVAAGGLGSPALLLRSQSESWPEGVGNRHDLVGRNLMFHLSEIVAIRPGKGADRHDEESRSISFRDLYSVGGKRFGLVQSMGLTAGYGETLFAMQNRFDASRFRKLRPLRQALRIPAYAATKILGPARLFVGVLEDLPYAANRLLPDAARADRLEVSYTISDELLERRATFRRAMRDAFRTQHHIFMDTKPQLNFAHPCGTVRFGDDPKTSVLDRDCRVHGVENLYVTDSSFMPTSNGVSPSLTIAANALRVAEHIADRLRP